MIALLFNLLKNMFIFVGTHYAITIQQCFIFIKTVRQHQGFFKKQFSIPLLVSYREI